MMKRIFLIAILAILPVAAALSQERNDTVTLGEVVVKAARTVRRIDGQTVYPTDVQRNSSASGYSLLQKLTLPGIRIDEASQSISSISNKGSVQIRVNGIVVGRHDLLALDVSAVTSVDFIDNPGVRYGQGTACVIDIHTRRADTGYSVGANTYNRLTSADGRTSVFASQNRGKGQFVASYESGYSDMKGVRTDEAAHYRLADGIGCDISRTMLQNRLRTYTNSVELKYNLADSARYVFQTTLSGLSANSPRTSAARLINQTGKTPYTALSGGKERSLTPVIDVYYSGSIGASQSLTADIVGTYIHTVGDSHYDEGTPYAYGIVGNTYSLQGEAVYENRMRPFTLSAGVNVNWKFMDNTYTGDVSSWNGMHTADVYAFAQIGGRFHRLGYMAGFGVSNRHSRQGGNVYDYWLCRPKIQLMYQLPWGIRAAYSFEVSPYLSEIAMMSDTRIRQNSIEWNVGNPNLKPSDRYEHNLTLAYDRPRFSTQLMAMFRVNRNCNMGKYELTSDNEILYSQKNQPHCNMLYINDYASYDIIPDRLQLMLNAGVARFFNRGDDYNHCYTAFSLGGYLTGYCGKWTMQLSADNGWRFMEAETKGYNAGTLTGAVSYRIGKCSITATIQNPFKVNPLVERSEVVNRYVGKTVSRYSRDAGNVVMIGVAWRLDGGRKYRDVEKRMNHSEKETGIMR